MGTRLRRSIDGPIRTGLSWSEAWKGADRGLIFCWERGRRLRTDKPELAAHAERGELVPLEWKGGVRKKLKGRKKGTLLYLATWQGLRGEDLDIDLEGERTVTCTRTGQAIVFSSTSPEDVE